MLAMTDPLTLSVLNVYKPVGPTSHDMVSLLRHKLGVKKNGPVKIGHMGTLDPFAEGVLPIAIGHTTRLIEYFATDKAYQAVIVFGKTTNTLDCTGELTEQSPCPQLTMESVKAALPEFTGTIRQEVPQHAAVKVNGKKLYEFAHQGIEVEAPVKTVTIHSLTLSDWDTLTEADFPRCTLTVECGSGTYIRALARDLGRRLGTVAHLTQLIRIRHGLFNIDNSVKLSPEKVLEPTLISQLESPLAYLCLPQITIAALEDIEALRHGRGLNISEGLNFKRAQPESGPVLLVSVPKQTSDKNNSQPLLLAVAQITPEGRLAPIKVFL